MTKLKTAEKYLRDAKKINGYQHYYITENGEVYSTKYGLNPLVQKIDKEGYHSVSLCVDGGKKDRKIHRLVASSFIPNAENKKEVNHIDGNKSNNMVENLEWCTYKENRNHAIKEGLIMVRPVSQYDKQMNHVCTYSSIYEAQEKTGIDRSNISRVINGKQKTAKGFYWKDAKPEDK